MNLKTGQNKYHSIGEPILGIEWYLESDGELCVKSNSLFLGYYKDKEQTDTRMHNGFLKTEDLISIDDRGYFYVTGRKNDFINVMGQKVYPKEIEETLSVFSEIKEVCVTAEADSARGQIPILHLVPFNFEIDKTSFEQKYLQSVNGKMDDFKIPRKFVWHQSFPKSPLGKVLKSKL